MPISSRESIRAEAPAEVVSVGIVACALGLIQVLIGGTRLIFSLPVYGLLAIVGLMSAMSLRTPKPQPAKLCLASSAIFFGYILTRAFFSPVAYIARSDIYSVLGGLVVYLFIAFICTSAKQRISILLFLLALALVHASIGAIQFRDGQNFMLISFLQRYDYGRRASGFYVCPNHLAGLLEVLGVFGTSIVCWSRFPTWAKVLVAYATAVCYVSIVLTGSHGGFLSSGTSLLVFGLLSLLILRRASTRLFWKTGGMAVVVALIAAACVVLFAQKSEFLTNRARNAFDSASIRLDFWQAGIQQWELSPLFGTGSGTYLYYGRLFRTEEMQKDPIDVHNDYLHLLAEYGAVGALLFLLFLGMHLRNGWKNFQCLGPKRAMVNHSLLSNSLALTLGALAAVTAYMVHSFVDFNLHIPANVLLLAFVFGLLANAGAQCETDGATIPMSVWWWRLLLPVVGAVLAVQCFRLLPGEYFAEHARTAQRDNHPDAAIEFASRGLATEHDNPYLYQYLASAQLTGCYATSDSQPQRSCYEQALGTLQKSRALAPQDRTFLLQLAFTYDALGRFPEAEWMFYEARKWDPKSVYLEEVYKYHLSQWRAAQPISQADRTKENKK